MTSPPKFGGRPRPDLSPTPEAGIYRDAAGDIFMADEPEPAANGTGPKRGSLQPRGVDLARVEPFRWAWQDRLLLGYLNLLVGDEGSGKGTLLAWLIARLTRGELPGDLHGKPTQVLIIGDEDGFDGVWTPRLHAAGADLALVSDLPVGETGALDIGRQADALRALIREHSFGVVVFDQLLDNLGADVDDWRSKSVRAAIAPLRRIAAETGVCPIAALHTNKSDAPTFRRRLAGTQAFNALSRSSLLLAEHPDDENRRVLLRAKGNYAAVPPAVEFSISAKAMTINGHEHRPTVAVDVTESTITIAEVLRSAEPATKADAGRRMIREALEGGKWEDAGPIRDELAAAGLSESGIDRAAADVGVERRRTEAFPARSQWRLARGGAVSGVCGGSGGSAADTPTTPTTPTSPTRLAREARLATPGEEADYQRALRLVGEDAR